MAPPALRLGHCSVMTQETPGHPTPPILARTIATIHSSTQGALRTAAATTLQQHQQQVYLVAGLPVTALATLTRGRASQMAGHQLPQGLAALSCLACTAPGVHLVGLPAARGWR